ncbi:MAG: dipeptide ABC transporter ATP-binding protein [Gammaproteobacteria bacterium]|nr:dipeptide ABC transporter ATP-binding protein [Gammaproteobacteria bacterium]
MPSIPAGAETAGGAAGASAVLRLERLGVSFHTRAGRVSAVREVTLSIAPGECLGVVGESGAGKSQLFLGVLGLLAANGRAYGSARFTDRELIERELIGCPPGLLERVRGAGIAMVFQDPMSSLTPHLTIGTQMSEVLRRHRGCGRRAALAGACALLERVHVSDAPLRLAQYPHELSGGMRQRVMIAIALSASPRLLILDEPTTALDVTIQAQILKLLAELKREHSLAMVLITHDLGAVAGVADRVAVMQAGELIESGTVHAVLKHPQHSCTQVLLREAEPCARPQADRAPVVDGVALRVENLGVSYRIGRRWLGPGRSLSALSEASFVLRAGESLGIVGESGAGKSTLARAVLRLLEPSAGRIVWMGRALGALPASELRALRRELQLIFQDPLGSLDPRMTVAEIVGEPLRVHEPQLGPDVRHARVVMMLERVGLDVDLAQRYSHELSGGQCQRVGIARAMILAPRLLVCDEPVSALDVSAQRQIVSLLQRLRREQALSLLLVSHNLAVVRRLCDRVLVLYLGRMMEVAPAGVLDAHPRHPYSRELLAALPVADPDVQPLRLARALAGEPPSPLSPPSGCVYRTRCPHALPVCRERVPAWEDLSGGHHVACHRWRELGGAAFSHLDAT